MKFRSAVPECFNTLMDREERFANQAATCRDEELLRLGLKRRYDKWKLSASRLKKRTRIPWPYVVETKEFMGLPFHVTPAVLIPRPSSATLVSVSLSHLKQTVRRGQKQINVLDLGTGSGCLLLALIELYKKSSAKSTEAITIRGVGVDISEEALAVAKRNASDMGLVDATAFLRGSFACLPPRLSMQKFDIILCNPPYHIETDVNVGSARSRHVNDVSVEHEPRLALFLADKSSDALTHYEETCTSVINHGMLATGGVLVFEAPPNLAAKIAQYMTSRGFSNVNIFKDNKGLQRCVRGNFGYRDKTNFRASGSC